MPNGPVVLRHGVFECVLSPRAGGSIARFTMERDGEPVELMRPTRADALDGPPTDLACFPLVPFSNRIAGGRFRFRGRDVALPLNMAGCPHAIHGHAWEAPWTVEEQGDSALLMSYRHEAGAWPWRYRATQRVTLGPEGLSVELDLVNEGEDTMPAGIGLHPYFPKPPGTVLSARTGSVWLNGATLLPTERAAVPAAWDFAGGQVMDDCVLDNGFAGWDGTAEVRWPSLGLALRIAAEGPFGHLVVYVPRGEDYLCVEPVSHMTDALNHAGEADAGLRPLAPGERLRGRVRFHPITEKRPASP